MQIGPAIRMSKQRNKRIHVVEVNEPESISSPTPPKLIWPNFTFDGFKQRYEESDMYQFPNQCIITTNNRLFNQNKNENNTYLGCKEFWQSFRSARIIYIIDKKFDPVCFKRVEKEIETAQKCHDYKDQQVKIFTSLSGEFKKTGQHKEIGTASISIFFIDKNALIHDRFVLMDNEIWHCGATIGGMHASLNALSGGWPDVGNCMRNYCEYLAKELSRR